MLFDNKSLAAGLSLRDSVTPTASVFRQVIDNELGTGKSGMNETSLLENFIRDTGQTRVNVELGEARAGGVDRGDAGEGDGQIVAGKPPC